MEELIRSENYGGPVSGNTVALRTPDSEVPMLIKQESGNEDQRQKEMYCWGGKLHNVPENFVIPRMTLQMLMYYWYCRSKNPHSSFPRFPGDM
jgi:hypothetical protein